MGFLEDDREYIEAIKEAKDWGSGYYLRKLFITMLISNSINRPENVWEQTWKWLADGILFQQRTLSRIHGKYFLFLILASKILICHDHFYVYEHNAF